MKTGYTDINIVLDRSGSMGSIRRDTIGGFNQFLKSQQSVEGEATITLIQFDDQYDVVLDAAKISDAKPLDNLTFIPRGSTALIDAIGRTIDRVGKRLELMEESERPEKVLFVILTDGEENASHEYNMRADGNGTLSPCGTSRINEMISLQRDVYQWEFVFLGANQDAISTASEMGISAKNAITYAANSAGVFAVMDSVNANVASYRAGVTRSASFTDDDRKKQQKAGVK